MNRDPIVNAKFSEEPGCAVAEFGHQPRPAIWRAWLLLALPPFLLAGLSVGYATLAVARAGGDRSVIGPAMGAAMPFLLIANHVFLYLLLLRFMRRDGLSARVIGWPGTTTSVQAVVREVVVGLLGGVLFYGIHVQVFGPLVRWIAGNAASVRLASGSPPLGDNLALGMAVAVILGGFVEEQLYRGYVLVRLSERMSVATAAVPMLLFFGLLHFGLGWTGMLVAMLTGLNLTLLFLWRRSMVSVILAHSLINLLVLAL